MCSANRAAVVMEEAPASVKAGAPPPCSWLIFPVPTASPAFVLGLSNPTVRQGKPTGGSPASSLHVPAGEVQALLKLGLKLYLSFQAKVGQQRSA